MAMPINIPFHMFLQLDIVLLPLVVRFVVFPLEGGQGLVIPLTIK